MGYGRKDNETRLAIGASHDCFRRLRFDVAVERIDKHLKEMWGKKVRTVGFVVFVVCLLNHLKKRHYISL